jgi:hypothetical protein
LDLIELEISLIYEIRGLIEEILKFGAVKTERN